MTHDQPARPASWSRELALWAGMLGAPIAWALNFQIAYALAEPACGGGSARWIYLCHGFFLLISGVALLFATSATGSGDTHDGEFESRLSRHRFMGILGIMTSVLFGLIIVAQLIASIMVPPCVE